MKKNPSPVLSAEKVSLRLDWATHEAARYACENWHYSRCIPKSKLVKIGVWENGRFIGVVIFGVGATSSLVSRYGLKSTEGCELVRVALTKHETSVSRIIAVSLKFLKQSNPGLKLVVSFADQGHEGHVGGIYQAGNWIYSGKSQPDRMYLINGEKVHSRTISSMIKARRLTRVQAEKSRVGNDGKHRYLMALDARVRTRILPLSKPYPKRVVSKVNVALTNQVGEGGAIPTTALQIARSLLSGGKHSPVKNMRS